MTIKTETDEQPHKSKTRQTTIQNTLQQQTGLTCTV